MFTFAEEEFLAKRHDRNWAPLSRRDLNSMPASVKARILEFRARELGPSFTEFRSLIAAATAINAVMPDDLATQVAGSKLF